MLAEELHKPVKRKFNKRRVMVSGIDKIWAADLADMTALSKDNEGVNFLLLVIDIFSKYGYLVPLKNKKGETVANALTLSQTSPGFYVSAVQVFQKHCGKR